MCACVILPAYGSNFYTRCKHRLYFSYHRIFALTFVDDNMYIHPFCLFVRLENLILNSTCTAQLPPKTDKTTSSLKQKTIQFFKKKATQLLFQ